VAPKHRRNGRAPLIDERPVVFVNRKGERLFGMLYQPPAGGTSPRIGVLFCVDAIKYRPGTYRLHTMLARWLAARGCAAMTFDPAGIGDSEGLFEEKFLRGHYLEIQSGKYTEDIQDAAAYFRSELQVDRLLLFGLCGGALSMLIAAATPLQTDGLILAAVPVLLEAKENLAKDDDEASTITSEKHAGNVLLEFTRKLGELDTWKRLARLRIDWRTNFRVAGKAGTVLFRKTAAKVLGPLARRPRGADVPMSSNPRFNALFQESFLETAHRGVPMLFVFADQDYITWQFRSEFQDIVLRPGNPWASVYELHEIAGANHIFSAPESRRLLFECIAGWLDRRFPAPNAG
jgi:pimeloyl-ACP methyl ester carboxylesterase